MSTIVRLSRLPLNLIAPRRIALSRLAASSCLRLTQRSPSLLRNTVLASREFPIAYSAMSSFSNADTGSKPADPYKAENKSDPELKAKIDDLVAFIESRKFGMMTTRIESSGLLVSRCMGVAARVWPPLPSLASPLPAISG